MRPISVLTLNAFLCRFFGRDLAPGIDRRCELIAAELNRLQPDVICLQEIWDAGLVPRLLSGLPEHRPVVGPTAGWGRPLGSGLVTATCLAVRESSFHEIASTRRLKEVLARRGLLISRLDWGGVELAVVNLHLGVGRARARRRQHRQALQLVAGMNGPAVLCGDLNTSASSAEPQNGLIVRELPKLGWLDAVRQAHGLAASIMITVDDHNPMVRRGFRRRIDYIWVKSQTGAPLAIQEARLACNEPSDRLYPSDHFGVLARFAATSCGAGTGCG